MLSKLTRILLALVTAVVFTGQMEAAAEHCARLAHEANEVEAGTSAHHGAPPCHEGATATDHHQPQPAEHSAPPAHAADHCECIAALNGWSSIGGPREGILVAPYAWLRPATVQFLSSEPDPDLRPPRI